MSAPVWLRMSCRRRVSDRSEDAGALNDVGDGIEDRLDPFGTPGQSARTLINLSYERREHPC